MQKEFDVWNIQKQRVHNNESHKLYHEREVWWCSLGTNVGFEQDGTGQYGERPVLIVKGFSAQVCVVIPLTTTKKINPYHVPLGLVDEKEAFAITSQIRLIDTRRLVYKVGFIDRDIFEAIRKTIRNFF